MNRLTFIRIIRAQHFIENNFARMAILFIFIRLESNLKFETLSSENEKIV